MAVCSLRDVEIFYEVSGDGEPLVLVHGALWDHNMWMLSSPIFAASCHVVTWDWPAHGQSSGDIIGDPLRVIDDLAALVEALDLAPAHFAGQSAGAQVILRLATRRPELFRSASLHEPGFLGLLPPPMVEEIAAVAAKVASLFRAGRFEDGLRSFLPAIGGDWATVPDPIRAILLQNAHNYVGAWFDDPRHALWNIAEDDLRELAIPVQITTGENGPAVHRAIAERLAELIGGACLSVIPGAGHAAMLEQPDFYAQTVLGFIADSGRS